MPLHVIIAQNKAINIVVELYGTSFKLCKITHFTSAKTRAAFLDIAKSAIKKSKEEKAVNHPPRNMFAVNVVMIVQVKSVSSHEILLQVFYFTLSYVLLNI